uniref:DUF2059 domain-containing protein n=2 Tax=Sphingomonas sp. GlSt437 TaxID=3389970 RepID=UPI003A89FB63
MMLAVPMPTNSVAPDQPAEVAIDPSRFAVARDVVELILPPDQRDAMFRKVIDAMMANMIAGQSKALGLDEIFAENPEIRDIFGKFAVQTRNEALLDIKQSEPELLKAYANAYARNFTFDELVQIRSFLATEAGKKFATRSTALLADPDVAKWQRALFERAERRSEPEVEKLKADIQSAVAKAQHKNDHS